MSSVKFLLLIIILSILIVSGVYVLQKSAARHSQKDQKTNQQKPMSEVSKVASPNATTSLPPAPSTQSGKPVDEFVNQVRQSAKETTTLNITKCSANPAVLKIKQGQKLTIKNNDAQIITLRVAAGAIYTVEASKTSTETINIEPAIYTYACDKKEGDSVARAGVIEVIK